MIQVPYVKQDQRRFLDVSFDPTTIGELTYLVYKLCCEWYEKSEQRFADHGQIIAALECAKLEWARDVMGPYEALCKATSGGVLVDDAI